MSLNDHEDCVNTLLFIKILNESFLLSGSTDTIIRVYDSNFKIVNTLEEHKGPVLALDYNPQLQIIASSSTNNTTKIWSFSYKTLTERKSAHKDIIKTICVLENNLIATGSRDTTIKIWKIVNDSSLELVTTLTEHKNYVWALTLLKNNSLVSGSEDKTIKVWNQINETTFECVATLNSTSNSRVLSLAIFESTLLMSGHRDGSIEIRNQTSFLLLQTLKRIFKVWSIILLRNGSIASGYDNSEIVIWQKINETSFSLNKILTGYTLTVWQIVILPNNMFGMCAFILLLIL